MLPSADHLSHFSGSSYNTQLATLRHILYAVNVGSQTYSCSHLLAVGLKSCSAIQNVVDINTHFSSLKYIMIFNGQVMQQTRELVQEQWALCLANGR